MITTTQFKEWLGILGIIVGLIVAAVTWYITMTGIPPRVDRLETVTSELKQRIDRNDIKTDIILDDVKTIKNFILNRHGGND